MFSSPKMPGEFLKNNWVREGIWRYGLILKKANGCKE